MARDVNWTHPHEDWSAGSCLEQLVVQSAIASDHRVHGEVGPSTFAIRCAECEPPRGLIEKLVDDPVVSVP